MAFPFFGRSPRTPSVPKARTSFCPAVEALEERRLLATFNPMRIPGYPALPTVTELGYPVVMQKFRGLAGPKGLPPAIIKTWEDVARKILADPEYKKSYSEENLVPNFMVHDQYAPFIDKFAADSANFLKTTGVIC